MKEYRLIPSSDSDCVKDIHIRYGVALYLDGCPARSAEDLSPDWEAVEGLVRLFNDEDLDPVHFDQAIEDFLIDFGV